MHSRGHGWVGKRTPTLIGRINIRVVSRDTWSVSVLTSREKEKIQQCSLNVRRSLQWKECDRLSYCEKLFKTRDPTGLYFMDSLNCQKCSAIWPVCKVLVKPITERCSRSERKKVKRKRQISKFPARFVNEITKSQQWGIMNGMTLGLHGTLMMVAS